MVPTRHALLDKCVGEKQRKALNVQVNERRELAPNYSRYREKTKSEKLRLRCGAALKAVKRLDKSGVPYGAFNNGVHIKIGDNIDYWPTSGAWIDQREPVKRWGIGPLLIWLEVMGV